MSSKIIYLNIEKNTIIEQLSKEFSEKYCIPKFIFYFIL